VSVEIFVQRLRARIDKEIESNHTAMDVGKEQVEYLKLVGRNAALKKVYTEFINEAAKELMESDDD
jgi:hypothetical protein